MPLPFSGNSIGDPKLRATEGRRCPHFRKYALRTPETDPRFAQKRAVGAGTNRNDAHFLKLSPRIMSHG